MKAFPLFAIVLVVLMAIEVESSTLTRCELVRAMREQNFPESQLRQWVCLVEASSGRQTHVVGPKQADGSRNHGLFQINDRYWCSTTRWRGRKGCRVRCQDLVKANIRQASRCAKTIYQQYGFGAWPVWLTSCQGELPSIKGC